jgi:hypothetical protein
MQWKPPGIPCRKEVCTWKSKIKTVLICFFARTRIVQQEFVPPGCAINQNFYLEVLGHLRQQMRLELFLDKWTLHHDDMPLHRVFIMEFLLKKLILVMEHPTYMYQILLCVTSSFPFLKIYHNRLCFEPDRYSGDYDGHSKQHTKQPWRSWVLAGRNYFEGDHHCSE